MADLDHDFRRSSYHNWDDIGHNEADAKITGLFLQNIVSMPDSTYDRYVLRLSLQQGRTQPMVYKSEAELISAVADDPAAVGYAWATDVARDPRVRILRLVWHD